MHSFRNMTRGALIVFEGLDRSGKTTQTEKLLTYLKESGRKAEIQRFPDRKEKITGKSVDDYLRNAKSIEEGKEAVHLLFSANRWLLKDTIEKHLNEGTTVIVDRYSFSGITYTLSKEVPKPFACASEIGLFRPDAVLFFDVDPEVAAQRGGYGGEVVEKADFQAKVRQHMRMFESRPYWKLVDANQSVDAVHENVKKLADEIIEQSHSKPLKQLTKEDFDL